MFSGWLFGFAGLCGAVRTPMNDRGRPQTCGNSTRLFWGVREIRPATRNPRRETSNNTQLAALLVLLLVYPMLCSIICIGAPRTERRIAPRERFSDSTGERRLQVGKEILRVFDPYREAEQISWGGAVGAFDRGAVLDQTLDPAERGRSLPDPNPSRGGDRRSGATPDAHT